MSSARQPPKPKRCEEMHPPESFALIRAQLAMKLGGGSAGCTPVNVCSALAGMRELLVDVDGGRGSEQRVEERQPVRA